jgi:hypothetical protein
VQILLPIPNLQYRGMVKFDPVINVLHQITPINYQVITLHTVNAIFNYDISIMVDIKRHKTAHALYTCTSYTIFHGMVCFRDPVENIRKPLDK